MDKNVEALFKGLLAVLPTEDQLSALEQGMPSNKQVAALAKLPHMPLAVGNVIADLQLDQGTRALQLLREILRELRKLNPEDLESADHLVFKNKLLDSLKLIVPGGQARATLDSLAGQPPKLDQKDIDAYCTPEQLQRMKLTVLPEDVRKDLAAQVISVEEHDLLEKSELPSAVVTQIEAAAPSADYVKELDRAAMRVADVEKVMMPASDRKAIASIRATSDPGHGEAAAKLIMNQLERMQKMAERLGKEVAK